MKSLAQIAQALEGYDPDALAADTVNAFLTEMVPLPTQTQSLELMHALGRVLAQDVISPIDVPAHDNSAMDGYAFDGSALNATQTLQLRVVGTVLAGKAYDGTVTAGQCLKIMTGAIVPPPLNTVVPQELVQIQGRDILIPPGLLRVGDNRRFRGEDVPCGSVALAAGTVLTPACMGLLASLGLSTVQVHRKLRVAYFSTGDEILSLGDAPREGAVYDSNRFTIWGLLQGMGIECVDLGVVRDDPVALESAFREAVRSLCSACQATPSPSW